jgi:hypothetical protein
MPRHRMVVLNNPVEGRDEEYHRWYDDVHVPEMLTLPMVSGAQRFDVGSGPRGGVTQRFACIYDIEADPAEAMAAIQAALPSMTVSDAIDREAVLSFFLTPRRDHVSAADGPGGDPA